MEEELRMQPRLALCIVKCMGAASASILSTDKSVMASVGETTLCVRLLTQPTFRHSQEGKRCPGVLQPESNSETLSEEKEKIFQNLR